MKISYNWLQDFFEKPLPNPEEIADKITFHAFEIESVLEVGKEFSNVVIGRVLKKEKHPNADRLNICTVDTGDNSERVIVCGAPNVDVGQTVAVALPGAVLPGDFEIKVSKIRGVESNGMICSERELGFGDNHEGIWVLPSRQTGIEKEVEVGTDLKDFLGIKTDYVFDIKVLPDRAHDCLSHLGIAREVGAIFEIPVKNLENDINLPDSSGLEISIPDSDICKRYLGAIVKNVTVKESPDWLKERLLSLGQRPINNIVDITNYVMLQTGQPLHAFDLSKISQKDGYKIVVRKSKAGEKIVALDDVSYDLPEDSILITDGNSNDILGVAGVKGGKASAISENTKDVLIESANFNPSLIRKVSQALKLRTESSVRFEKEISTELAEVGLKQALKLIQDIASGEISGVSDIYPEKQTISTINFDINDVYKTLGVNVPAEKISNILSVLGCEVSLDKETFNVKPPFWRLDLNLKEDLIEEVGRLYGYENIEAEVLPDLGKKPKVNKLFFYTSKISDILVGQGFSEIKTYSFRNNGLVEVLNPIAGDKSFLRKDLYSGLKESFAQNEYNAPLLGLEQIRVFEIGTVFEKDSEHISLCIGVKNTKGYKKEKEEDVLKSILETLEKEVSISGFKDLEKGIVEINLEEVIEKLPEPEEYNFNLSVDKKVYSEISAYPFILRDIAVFVPENMKSEDVGQIISKNAGKLLVRMDLFDEFRKEGKVSFGFRLVFQSKEKTLSDEEINKIMDRITSEMNKKEGWEVR